MNLDDLLLRAYETEQAEIQQAASEPDYDDEGELYEDDGA